MSNKKCNILSHIYIQLINKKLKCMTESKSQNIEQLGNIKALVKRSTNHFWAFDKETTKA